jgi:WD40 repeat protein
MYSFLVPRRCLVGAAAATRCPAPRLIGPEEVDSFFCCWGLGSFFSFTRTSFWRSEMMSSRERERGSIRGAGLERVCECLWLVRKKALAFLFLSFEAAPSASALSERAHLPEDAAALMLSHLRAREACGASSVALNHFPRRLEETCPRFSRTHFPSSPRPPAGPSRVSDASLAARHGEIALSRLVATRLDTQRCVGWYPGAGGQTTAGDPPEVPALVARFSHAALGGSLLAVGDDAGGVSFLDTRVLGGVRTVHRLSPHRQCVQDLRFSPDDRRVLTAPGLLLLASAPAADRHGLRLTDIETKAVVALLPPVGPSGAPASCCAFQPGSGGQVVAVGGSQGDLALFDLRAGGNAGAKGKAATAFAGAHAPSGAGEEGGAGAASSAASSSSSLPPPPLVPLCRLPNAHSLRAKTGVSLSPSTSLSAAASSPSAPGRGGRTGSSSSVSAICFATDRFLVSGGASDGVVRFWDTRRLPTSASASSRFPSGGKRKRSLGVPNAASVSGGGGGGGGDDDDGLDGGVGIPFGPDGSGAVASLHQPHVVVGSQEELEGNRRGVPPHGARSGRRIDEDEEDAEAPNSSSSSSSSRVVRWYGVSSVEVSPSAADEPRLLVAYKSSRILLYDLSRICAGGGGVYGASDELPASLYTAAGLRRPSYRDDVLGDEGDEDEDDGGQQRRGAPRARPVGDAAFTTPPRSTVRTSRAWYGISSSSSDSLPLPAHRGPTVGGRVPFEELGGHLNPSAFIKAHFSPCGNYVVSGSADYRAYIWSLDRRGAAGGALLLPSHVLGLHRSYVGDVAWGGTPSSSCMGPSEHTRIATVCDDARVRVWGPCASDRPGAWFASLARAGATSGDGAGAGAGVGAAAFTLPPPSGPSLLAAARSNSWRLRTGGAGEDAGALGHDRMTGGWVGGGFPPRACGCPLNGACLATSAMCALALAEGSEVGPSYPGFEARWSIPYARFAADDVAAEAARADAETVAEHGPGVGLGAEQLRRRHTPERALHHRGGRGTGPGRPGEGKTQAPPLSPSRGLFFPASLPTADALAVTPAHRGRGARGLAGVDDDDDDEDGEDERSVGTRKVLGVGVGVEGKGRGGGEGGVGDLADLPRRA